MGTYLPGFIPALQLQKAMRESFLCFLCYYDSCSLLLPSLPEQPPPGCFFGS